MEAIVSEHLKELRALCAEFDVQRMYIFGSAASGTFTEASDLDFLIAFKDIPVDRYTDNYFDLHQRLESLFSRKVDLLTEPAIKNPYFAKSVNDTKQLLYAA
jgi:predicted nucleotidyltransferase